MQLPFTAEQFFGVFRLYNSAVWPADFGLLVACDREEPVTLGAFGRLVVFLFLALDANRAVFQQCNDSRDCRDNRRQHGSDDARRERELGDRSALVLNDDAPHVAFVDERLQLLDRRFTFGFERFPICLGFHDNSQVQHSRGGPEMGRGPRPRTRVSTRSV